MIAKFVPGTSNSAKQAVIAAAKVTLLNGVSTDIPDVVQLQSTIQQRMQWVFPCGPSPIERQSWNGQSGTIFQRPPPPCEGCPPPNCDPYQVPESYDNFYEALNYLLANANILSASKALVAAPNKFSGTGEDFYIKIQSGFTISDFALLLSTYGLTASDASADLGSGVYKIAMPREASQFCIERANEFFQTGKCIYAVPNFYEFHVSTTADPLWNEQWGSLNTGQHSGLVGADVRVEPAWLLSEGAGVRVAVIDNGVQLDHPDFRRTDAGGAIIQNNMLPGFDAVGGVTNGAPINIGNTHGTACAGIIGAVADNNIGISGIAPRCQIIPIRGFTATSSIFEIATSIQFAEAITWAWENGADVISCSWKVGLQNDVLEGAIIDATTRGRGGLGCIVVFASGKTLLHCYKQCTDNQVIIEIYQIRNSLIINYLMEPCNKVSGNENVSTLDYPAGLDEVIAVGAMTMCNSRKNPQDCSSENWGSAYGEALEMVAPGVNIPTLSTSSSTLPNFMGTSAACPYVAGIAALVLGINSNFTAFEVRRILESSCNKVGPYCYNSIPSRPNGAWNNQMGYGRVNAFNAVQLASQAISYAPQELNVTAQTNVLLTPSSFSLSAITAGCSPLASGSYLVQRYEVSRNISFPNTSNPLILCTSNGWSAANPNESKNFAQAQNVTNTSATLRSYVYKGYNMLGQFIGWFPRAPQDVTFSYRVIGGSGIIGHQLFRANGAVSPSGDNKTIPFQFDHPGPTNDVPVHTALSADKVLIYPTPARDNIRITVNLSEGERVQRIEVYAVSGTIVKQLQVASSSVLSVSVTDLPAGMYRVQVRTTQGMYAGKLVKQ